MSDKQAQPDEIAIAQAAADQIVAHTRNVLGPYLAQTARALDLAGVPADLADKIALRIGYRMVDLMFPGGDHELRG